jgi:protein-disulfide isomerase
MKSTTMVAIVGLIVAVMLASVVDAQQLPIPSLPTGVSRGNPNAPIHLVEFLDYQCLHCKGTCIAS